MQNKALSILLLVLAWAPLSVHAATKDPFALTATSAAEFRAQADQLRLDMGAGGKYAHLSAEDRAKVGKQLDILQSLYDAREQRKSFTGADEVRLVNATEEINGTLVGDADDRMVCEQVRKLGSNRTQKLCMTVGERRAAREESKKNLGDRQMGKATY
ncbi:MAG: hypothetical protein J0L88_11925 [Xanthomonadales bacterium]|nr:hypothetical protein [Xanthomonadales bacterium]